MFPDLSDELMQGYRILTEIFGDKCKSFVWPFLEPVDTETLWDYEIRIKHPMWLRKIESKFFKKEYQDITEFAADMRQMLENCYRYNGMKHQISKYAQTLECVFEQKLALLSRPLQEKTTLYVTSNGKYGDGSPNTVELSSGRLRRACTRLAARALEQASATPLAFHVGRELEQQEREEKRQKIVDRRDEILKERQDLLGWDKQLIGEAHWTYMKSLWEIPAIGHFLCLCQSVLELDEISFFELERSFAIPMESTMLRRIFTSLLSTPYQRTRLGKKPPMPYKVWEARLREWVRGWYIVLDKLRDPIKVYEKIGVPERFFEVLGPYFPLDKLQYHELTYYERVWVTKALCDQLFETQLSVRRCVLSQPVEELRPIVLGVDGEANSYIHFPHFCGADLRIYRQSKYPDLLKAAKRDKVKSEGREDREAEQDAPRPRKLRKTPALRKQIPRPKPVTVETPRSRPSRLRQKLTPTVHFGTYAESIISSTESEDVTSEFTEIEDDASDSQWECQTTPDQPGGKAEAVEGDDREDLKVSRPTKENEMDALVREEKHQPSQDTGVMKREQITDESVVSAMRQGAVAKPDGIEPLCNGETSSIHSSTTSENASPEDPPKLLAKLETKEEIREESGTCHHPTSESGMRCQGTECNVIPEGSLKMEVGSEAATPSEGITASGEQNANNNSSQTLDAASELEPLIEPDKKPCDATSPTEGELHVPPSSPPPPHKEVLPVLGEFELVCDSMESLRELVDKFAPPENKNPPPTTGRKRKVASYIKQPVRRRCEKDLHEKLTNLLLELTPYEARLAKFALRNREKFKKEYESAKMEPETDQDIKDIWASEESSSESESEAESGSEEEDQAANDQDEEWDASTEGTMRLRKRTVKRTQGSATPDDGEEAEDGEPVQEEAAKKPKRPRPSGRRSPPHKNQLNTSLLQLIKNLSNDGLSDACRRLQTMIKRAEAARYQMAHKSKLDPASLSDCGDGQAVTALLNKLFWVNGKPPAVEGNVAKTVEELISTYPMFVHNLIFRNLKNSLSKMAKVAKSTGPDSSDQKDEPESKEENLAVESEPSKEVVQPASTDADTVSDPVNSSSRMETRSSASNTTLEGDPKWKSKEKRKEVMDDFTLAGLYTVLAQAKGILRERLATGLSELLPDYPNLQESVVKTEPKKDLGDSVNPDQPSSRSDTDKELLFKMLPKPSQYQKNSQLALQGSAHVKYMSSVDVAAVRNSTRPGSSLLVSVPTAKLPTVPNSWSDKELAKGASPARAPLATSGQAAPAASTSQIGDNVGAVPHGVYTIKVDASVWSQLQGKPQLQQQFVLQQIREMQRKQAESGSMTTSGVGLSNPAQAVTCIRSPPKAQAVPPKTSSETRTTSSPARNTARLPPATNISDLSSLQPIKLSKPARPKARNRGGLAEPVSNLSQKELIALLQQQQRQLELYRQQQQQKQQSQQKNGEPQQQQPLIQEQANQHFVLSASGELRPSTRSQQATGAAKAPIVLGVRHTAPSVEPSQISASSCHPITEPLPVTAQPTRLSTKTTVTASLKHPKMTVNPVSSQHCATVPSATTVPSQSRQSSPIVQRPPAPQNSTSSSVSPRGPSTRFHLVQTSSGTQFVVRTGPNQAPRLISLSSVGNSGSTVPVIMTGQNRQFVKQTSQAAALVVSTTNAATVSMSQTVQFVMQPGQVIRNAAPASVSRSQQQTIQGSGGPLLGQATGAAQPTDARQNPTQAALQANQDRTGRAVVAMTNQSVGMQGAVKAVLSQVSQTQNQAAPAAIQKPQLAVVKGAGDSKVVVASPKKVVRLVHPSHLSTAATFVPTTDPSQVGSMPIVVTKALPAAPQGVQVVAQTPARQQLVHLPVKSRPLDSAVAAAATQGSPSGSTTAIQEHLQQVILQQLAAGKLKLSPQTIPVSKIGHQVVQQPVQNQQKAGQVVNAVPIVLSQQASQLITKLQQSVPATIKTSPPAASSGTQLDQQLQASIQILNQARAAGQAPAVRLLAVGNAISQKNLPSQETQSLQPVNPASPVAGPLGPRSSHLVLAQPSVSSQVVGQALPSQIILPTALTDLLTPPSQTSLQTGAKRSLPMPPPLLDPKIPRLTAPVQASTAQAVPATTLSGLPPDTTQGTS
ncbi:uncharacterized protein LOC110977272 isoform X2 [Acanthaster planci]|uniref:Uncharacterized protein LOC110977272 isoform X2 n=1 Tax=Acanthaster planci TaxID=133434 RepID=A0A8B7Y1A1_ACAPL|nr:uncharacterized protein LOC110977272 isoform X2 [Acanthaster planci]